MKTLKDCMDSAFYNEKAGKYADVEVVKEHSDFNVSTWKRWIGNHKNVHYWVELANGYAVGFNENPATGWSFPVVRIK
jgi:hypothetical protein